MTFLVSRLVQIHSSTSQHSFMNILSDEDKAREISSEVTTREDVFLRQFDSS